MESTRLALSVLALSLASCVTPAPDAEGDAPAAAPARTAEAAAPAKPAAEAGSEAKPRVGVVAPAEFAAIALWPEAFKGELLVLSATAHGSPVAAGDEVATLDTRAIDRQIEEAERALRSAEIQHEGLVQKNRIAADAAKANADAAAARLERARRSLEGFKTHELAFSKRSDEVTKMREVASVADQKDELAQLQAMYEADELVDETEDIVLKRAIRNLEWTEIRNALSRDRRDYQVDYTEAMSIEKREEELRLQELALERQVRQNAVEERGRADAEARSAAGVETKRRQLEELRRDRELFVIRAPAAGVLLHGDPDAYRPGGKATRLERGTRLTARQDVALVAVGAAAEVRIDVPESSLTAFGDRASVRVEPIARPDMGFEGELDVSAWPSTKPSGEEATFEGAVRLNRLPRGVVFGMRARVSVEDGGAE